MAKTVVVLFVVFVLNLGIIVLTRLVGLFYPVPTVVAKFLAIGESTTMSTTVLGI